MGVIVLGVDGSEGAKAALRFGLDEATLRQAMLRAVHAWQFGYVGVPAIEGAYPGVRVELNELHQPAEAVLDSALAQVPGGERGLTIERRSSRGRRPPCSSTSRVTPTCSSSAHAATAASRGC